MTEPDCSTVREVLSADLDGEADPTELAEAERHERRCPGCARWHRETAAMARSLRLGSAVGGPDLTARVLATAEQAGVLPAAARDRVVSGRLTPWRVALALVALGQLCIGLSQLLGMGAHSHGGADGAGHLFNESTAWNLALGVGFAAAAAWPRSARGLLPAALVFLVVLVAYSAADLAAGTTTPVRVASHVLVLLGTLLLLAVDRASRRGPGHGHRADADDLVLFGDLPGADAEVRPGPSAVDGPDRHFPHRAA